MYCDIYSHLDLTLAEHPGSVLFHLVYILFASCCMAVFRRLCNQ